eukprot:CAMPEP_0201583634 /NCGR_PEP_ID=MMETSP0190_2-20130828/100785_1 /ASSEMBLY_ACC=CAM_ASM_000263 /TAXON_ID=37353 /ORGANISM="Rosalina sp." /LENGTH=39 /DNA_ID= /DNA_START= /DNA_END= /DNA_ORIENTATION=
MLLLDDLFDPDDPKYAMIIFLLCFLRLDYSTGGTRLDGE